MSARAVFDLLVIGADAAGAAAAACAAKSGAKVALLATGGETPPAGMIDEPPNFVWRLLDLHLFDLPLEPPAALTTFSPGDKVTTTADAARTGEWLAAREGALEHLWPAFAADMRRAFDRESALPDKFLSANALLDDYFADETLKAHVIASRVAPFGLAGDEAGSAAALAGVSATPRRRMTARALQDALDAAAATAGVERIAGGMQALLRTDGKTWKALSDGGRDIRARKAMASCALLGEAAGLCIAASGSPLLRRSGVEALVRIRYDKRIPAAARALRGVGFTAGDRAAVLRARDAMIDGRIEDAPLLSFEVCEKEIVARVPFCPARLTAGDEMREWTGQDKQVLGRRAAEVIASALGGTPGAPREIVVTIGADPGAGLSRRSFDIPPVAAPSPSSDPVGAAASLAMELVRDD